MRLDAYRFAPAPIASPAAHLHSDYQIGMSAGSRSAYQIGRRTWPATSGAVTVIPPGVPHRCLHEPPFDRPTVYRLLFLPPDLMTALVSDPYGGKRSFAAFGDTTVADPVLARRFATLTRAIELGASTLALEERLAAFAARLSALDPHRQWPPPPGREPQAVALVRDYLIAHPVEHVSLRDLGRLAGLSPNHLAAVFSRHVGIPPHAFHLAVRIDAARSLLATGWPPADVASAAGFHDQSHLARHFRRLVGTTPGTCARRRKNVQDGSCPFS